VIELLFPKDGLAPCPHDGRPARLFRDEHQRVTVGCTRCTLALSAFSEAVAKEKWNHHAEEVRKFLAAESACDNRFAYLKHRGDVRNCCKNPDNLEIVKLRPDLMVATCRKCETKHRKLKCEPLSFSTLGGAAELARRMT
jgi:hypothetical protein